MSYEAEDGTAVAGETEQTVSVEVLDDAHHEGNETLTFRLVDPVPDRLEP